VRHDFVVRHQRGDSAAAATLIRQACKRRPQFPLALNNLGGILARPRPLTRGAPLP
jgi:Flp pilus assembly protein TadD